MSICGIVSRKKELLLTSMLDLLDYVSSGLDFVFEALINFFMMCSLGGWKDY